MSYPGNSSLAADIQERILSTFGQTLDLATKGDRQHALVGCDFILRLDPLFEPATRLKERLQQGEGAILVDDLRLAGEPPAAAAPSPAAEPPAPEAPVAQAPAPQAPAPETPVPQAPAPQAPAPEAPDPQAPAAEPEDIFQLGARSAPQPPPPEPPQATQPVEEPHPTPSEALPAAGPEEEPEEAIPGLMVSPAAKGAVDEGQAVADASDEPGLFSAMDTDELESVLDLESLGAPETEAQPAVGTPQTAAPVPPPVPAPPAAPQETGTGPAPPQPQAPEIAEPAPHAEPTAALDAESEQRINDLLSEGQGAFEAGEYQSAIDAWSRIFLIDIDHQEASRRIELARKLKAEVERQVEELFHEAVARVEAGDFAAAREGFSKVLEMQSSHLAAQEYLEKLDSGSLEASEEPAVPEGPPAAPPEAVSMPREPLAEPASELDAVPGGELEIPADLEALAEAAPAPPVEARMPPVAPTPAKPTGVRKSVLYIGGAVLVLALGVSWLLYRNFDDTFPNAGQQVPPAARPRVDVIARAQQVFEEGNAALAIAQLKRLPPNHPRYAEAQALIAQWETPSAGDAEAEEPVSEEVLAERDRLVGEAKLAFDRREFLLSHELLTRAAAIAALDETALQLQTAAVLELQPLRSEIEIFRQGEWGEALRALWQIRESDPGNPDVRRLMVDSYYNLGVRDLQRRDPVAAAQNLREALELAGSDEELERVLDFAETYQNRSIDLLYRIFVKYLPFR